MNNEIENGLWCQKSKACLKGLYIDLKDKFCLNNKINKISISDNEEYLRINKYTVVKENKEFILKIIITKQLRKDFFEETEIEIRKYKNLYNIYKVISALL